MGARIGLARIMNIGLLLQIIALAMLLVPVAMLTVPWVMFAQALSGIAKDLNKMSAKASVKNLVPSGEGNEERRLFKWVARTHRVEKCDEGFRLFPWRPALNAVWISNSDPWYGTRPDARLAIKLDTVARQFGPVKQQAKIYRYFFKESLD